MRWWIWTCALVVITGCSGGAVVFAPTPAPPDLSPSQYEHPSGAFSLILPRTWTVFDRNATTLATASFAPPNTHTPVLTVSVIRLAQPPDDAAGFVELLNTYQATIRPGVSRYNEQDRQAMGDGSWRLTGLRQSAAGTPQQLNTFVELDGTLLVVTEIILLENEDLNAIVQAAINTLTPNPEAPLQPTDLGVLSFSAADRIAVLRAHPWTSPQGVFFISGEIANYGEVPLTDIPVRATLYTEDGRAVAEAVDTVMGHGVAPGGFAPFSLRFGQGQPPLSATYTLSFGDETWQPDTEAVLYAAERLTWTDESSLSPTGELLITGTLTNTGQDFAYLPRLTVTVFDDAQQVIGAAFTELEEVEMEPGESVPYEIIVPELGGAPTRYIVSAQARP